MSINGQKITDAQIAAAGVQSQPNKLTGTAQQNKAVFDALVKNLVKARFNALIDELTGSGAAAQLGVDPFSGMTATNVQDALAELVQAMEDITQGSVADGSISTAKLADGAVTEDKIESYAVTGAKIAAAAVTAAKLAADAVTAAKILDGAVTQNKLADNAVREAKLGNYQVSEIKIASQAVTTSKLANLAVTAAKLAADAVETGKIKDLAVTAAKLAANAVETGKIKDSAVTAAKLASSAVETGKIKDGAVTDAKLAATAAIRMKKLWENSSPDSSFGEQDVSISGLSGYDLVLILYRNWESGDSLSAVDSVIGAKGYRAAMYCSWGSTGIRHATIYYQNTNKIHFSPCIYNGANYNTYCVPLQIYGIKGTA